MRILIVDDDYVSRLQLKALLMRYGDCDTAPMGKIALELFEIAHREQAPYDLITLDIDMPGLNGHAVIKAVRDFERVNAVVVNGRVEAKVLMISGLKDSTSIMSSFQEGCEGYLQKPVTAANLTEALDRFHLLE
jgi:two-component system chemotaxis response regulator CheY